MRRTSHMMCRIGAESEQVLMTEPAVTASVKVLTTFGEFVIELWGAQCPVTVDCFLQRVQEGYYAGLPFCRIEAGRVAQLSSRNPTHSSLQERLADDELPLTPDEFHSRLRYTRRGLVGLVNEARPNSNGPAFFITMAPLADLNNVNVLFGRISIDTRFVPWKLEQYQVDDNKKPLYPPVVHSISILTGPPSLSAPRPDWVAKHAFSSHSAAPPTPKPPIQRVALTSDAALLSFDDAFSLPIGRALKSLSETTQLSSPVPPLAVPFQLHQEPSAAPTPSGTVVASAPLDPVEESKSNVAKRPIAEISSEKDNVDADSALSTNASSSSSSLTSSSAAGSSTGSYERPQKLARLRLKSRTASGKTAAPKATPVTSSREDAVLKRVLAFRSQIQPS